MPEMEVWVRSWLLRVDESAVELGHSVAVRQSELERYDGQAALTLSQDRKVLLEHMQVCSDAALHACA